MAMIGKVRSFKNTWGFLTSDSVKGDVFVGLNANPHLTTLAEGTRVLFDIRQDARGKKEAVNVQPLIKLSESSDPLPTRYSGWVRSFTGSWGFINSSSFTGDLFVGLRNNPQLPALAAGDEVEFDIRQMDGKSEAIDVLVRGQRPPARIDVAEKGAHLKHLVGQELQGTVRSFRDAWGFVVSEAFEGDLYVHRRSNPDLGPLQSGDPVTFQVSEDPEGHFAAVHTRVLRVPLIELQGQRLFGWVKSYYPEHWGFLASHRFDGEVFFSLEQNPQLKMSLKMGEAVTFKVEKDEASGELQAVDVALANTVQAPLPNAVSSELDRQTYVGKVKSFRDDWGFIVSDSFEGDVFLHLRDTPGLTPLSPGETVEFTMVFSDQKAHAENVQRVRPMLSELMGQICTGTVRKFSKDWGFITSPHFEGDLFVGLRSNRHLGAPLVAGDIINFQVTRDLSKGKEGGQETFEASNVHILSPGTSASPLHLSPPTSKADRSRSPRKLGSLEQMAPLMNQTLTGTVRSFRGDWGFVTSDSFTGDLFVGIRSNPHLKSLKEGDAIQFRVECSKRKPEAVDVQLL